MSLFNITAGTILDERFEVEEILGAGGFATVYRAKQLNIGRTVAIKVMGISPHKHPDEIKLFQQRFYMEAKSAASIDHPDIVTIHDYGVTKEGLPFIVMELLDGHTLEDEVDQNGPMEPSRALSLFVRCLDTLQAAHAQKIIHKDLKPSNLFVTKPGSFVESIRILDFGIAAIADAKQDQRLTATDQYIGTAAYCAPEYYEHKLVSPALDIYQMGLVLAEILTGRPVVEGINPMRAIIAHCTGELTLPWKLLQSPIGDILSKALAQDPQDRYENAGEFRDVLATIDPATIPNFTAQDLQQRVPITQNLIKSDTPPSGLTGEDPFDDPFDDNNDMVFGETLGGNATLNTRPSTRKETAQEVIQEPKPTAANPKEPSRDLPPGFMEIPLGLRNPLEQNPEDPPSADIPGPGSFKTPLEIPAVTKDSLERRRKAKTPDPIPIIPVSNPKVAPPPPAPKPPEIPVSKTPIIIAISIAVLATLGLVGYVITSSNTEAHKETVKTPTPPPTKATNKPEGATTLAPPAKKTPPPQEKKTEKTEKTNAAPPKAVAPTTEPKKQLPPLKSTVRFSTLSKQTRFTSLAKDDERSEQTQTGTLQWAFQPGKTPWIVEVSSPRHISLFLKMEHHQSSGKLEVTRGSGTPKRIQWAKNSATLSPEQDGAFQVDANLKPKRTRPPKGPRRTPGNQIID